MIIVIEGFDQAGKRTQSELLAKFLKARKLKYKIFNFPDYTTPIGKEIKHYLYGKRKFPSQVIHCLLAANRWEKLKESNLVYGKANGQDLKWLLNLDSGLPKENLVILLDVKSKDSFSRKKIRRDKFEKDKKFAQKIIYTYRILAKKFGWKIINATQTQEQVHKAIKELSIRYIK